MGQHQKNGARFAAALLLLLPCMTGCGKKQNAAEKEEMAKARGEMIAKNNVKQDNDDAKALSEAVNAAVSDYMAWGGGSLSQINGDYVIEGSTLSDTNGATLIPKEKLLYLVGQHDDLNGVPEAAFRLENGRCVYAVVQNRDAYGAYPEAIKAEDLPYLDSMQEAADYAKNGMNSRIQQLK